MVAKADAKKNPLREAEALRLAAEVDEIYVARRNNVIHWDLRKEKPSRAELLGALLGPTGNLRAPAIRKGRTLIVGFHPDTYRRLVK